MPRHAILSASTVPDSAIIAYRRSSLMPPAMVCRAKARRGGEPRIGRPMLDGGEVEGTFRKDGFGGLDVTSFAYFGERSVPSVLPERPYYRVV